MRTLENRTKESKREMDILDALDEIREMTRADSKINSDDLFNFICKRDTSVTSKEEEYLMQKFVELKRKRQMQLTEQKIQDTAWEDPVKKLLKGGFEPHKIAAAQSIGDEVAQELIGPGALANREPVFEKMTDLGNGLWDLHTKIIIKKHIEEPEPLTETGTEEMTQKAEYRFPQTEKPPSNPKLAICDYSSSEEENQSD